jgi:seryl-tRNA synthetase
MPDVLREIAELEGQIEELRQELDGQLNPFERKRLQDEIARLRRLQIAAQAKLKRLLEEFADVQQEIQSILAEIQDEERQAQYVVEGADKVEHMIVGQDGSVDAFVRFDLVRADASRTGLDVLLSLQFSAAGLLVSGEAVAKSPFPCDACPGP